MIKTTGIFLCETPDRQPRYAASRLSTAFTHTWLKSKTPESVDILELYSMCGAMVETDMTPPYWTLHRGYIVRGKSRGVTRLVPMPIFG